MDRYDKALGQVIRRCRLHARLSQSNVADAIGRSYQLVQKYESGRSRVTFGTLVRISEALEVPVERIVREARDLADREPAG